MCKRPKIHRVPVTPQSTRSLSERQNSVSKTLPVCCMLCQEEEEKKSPPASQETITSTSLIQLLRHLLNINESPFLTYSACSRTAQPLVTSLSRPQTKPGNALAFVRTLETMSSGCKKKKKEVTRLSKDGSIWPKVFKPQKLYSNIITTDSFSTW